MHALTLSRLIRRLTAASLAFSFGCGGAGVDPALFSAPICATGGILSVDGLKPATATDYIALRQNNGSSTPPLATILSETGTRCAGAADMTACANAFAALPATPGFNNCVDHPCEHTLGVTAGSSVRVVADMAAVAAFLGTIDTAQEAALQAFAADYDVSCSDRESGGVRPSPDGDGYEVLASRMTRDCAPIEVTGYQLKVSATGVVSELSSRILSSSPACVGRRPAGLADERQRGPSPVGAYFAEVARLEAAAVAAFAILRDELTLHGAPAELVQAAVAAMADEVRHAEVTARLARRHGALPQPPRVAERRPRPLYDVLLDNAVEGCVRETFGAAVGAYQAERAADPAIAQAMAAIAEDEARHAELSFRIAAWADSRISDTERRALHAARRQAVATLYAEAEAPLPSELTRLAGLPPRAEAVAILGELDRSLWA